MNARTTVQYAVLLLALSLLSPSQAEDHYDAFQLTFIVPPKHRECFYHEFEEGQALYMEFQVIAGGEGDIDFILEDPLGSEIENYRKSPEESVSVEETVKGEYMFCFDNSFSSYSSKRVFFDLVHEGIPIEETKDAPDPILKEITDQKVARLEIADQSISRIMMAFSKISYFQSMFRAYEARDRWMLEFKFARINFWSTINIFVMLTVFFMQVYTVKRMLTISTATPKK